MTLKFQFPPACRFQFPLALCIVSAAGRSAFPLRRNYIIKTLEIKKQLCYTKNG